MLGIYSLSIEVSSRYFIGPDNRVKFFPDGINLLSTTESEVEPLGVASLECSESGCFLVNAFRVRDGLDISRLVMIAKSPGVINFDPEKIILPTHLKNTISQSAKQLIKSYTGVRSISFSSLDSDLAKSLPMHEFSLSDSNTDQQCSIEELIATFNKSEYERAIRRTILNRICTGALSQITGLRLANAVMVDYPKIHWRSAINTVKPDENKICVVTEKIGLLDICVISDRIDTNFHGGGFGGHAHSNFADWMDGFDDDDDDDDDISSGEDEDSVHLGFENNMYRLFVYQMLVAHADFDEDTFIDPDYIEYLFEEEGDLSLSSYNIMNEVILGDCIFKNVDSENIGWAPGILSENSEVLRFFELCPPNQSKYNQRLFITWHEYGVHITIMESFRYRRDNVVEVIGIMTGVDVETVRISAKHMSQITSMIDLVDNHESMIAAVKLIARVLSVNYEDHFDGLVDRY